MVAERKQGTDPTVMSLTHEGDTTTPREVLVAQWRDALPDIQEYDPAFDPESGRLLYPGGKRLVILGEQVMDTCETPWCRATVDAVFENLQNGSVPIRVLERGYGLGITANLIMQKLIGLGKGEYHIIELNKEVAQDAREFRESWNRRLRNMGLQLPDTRPQISITVHEGDAYEVTKRLAESGEQFHIIFSDTYPVAEEHGLNDIFDVENIKVLLSRDPIRSGRFTFPAHFPGSTGGLVRAQDDLLGLHFNRYGVQDYVEVNPPPDYSYLQGVRSLPIIMCRNPKFSP